MKIKLETKYDITRNIREIEYYTTLLNVSSMKLNEKLGNEIMLKNLFNILFALELIPEEELSSIPYSVNLSIEETLKYLDSRLGI